jgi:hypothetical protein
MSIDGKRVSIEIKLDLKSKRMIDDVAELMERVLPLNMRYYVKIMYNQYAKYQKWTHAQMRAYTHRELRSESLEEG